ncbi:MAG: hypothetical protein RLZZ45_1439, partial [Bacteroidota bacterium]
MLMTKMTRISFLLGFMALLNMAAMAQNIIKGKVLGPNNQPVANATVGIDKTSRASKTNEKGEFSIAANKGETLLISSVGFITKQVKVGDQSTISVKLAQDEST